MKDAARRRIIVISLAAVDGVGGGEHHDAGFGIDGPAGQLEAIDVPGRLGAAAALDPFLRSSDEIGFRYQRIDELHRFGAVELYLLALEQKLQRVRWRHYPWDPLRAASAGEQSDL